MKKSFLTALMAAAWFAVLFCGACGKKGPLVLEPQPEPTAPSNIELRQVGDKIRVQWDFPKQLNDKKTDLAVSSVDRVDIHYSNKEIPGGRFPDKSSVIAKLEPGSFFRYTDPAVVSYLQRLPENQRAKAERLTYYAEVPFDVSDLNNKVHFFSVRFHYSRKKSPVGDVVAIHTQTPVKPVGDLSIIQEKKVLTLKWSKPAVDVKGAAVSAITGYKIFRKLIPKTPESGETPPPANNNNLEDPANGYLPLGQTLKEVYSDADTSAEGLYRYYVVSLAGNAIESASSNVVEMNVTDLYPPDVPANLVALRSSGFIFLTWGTVKDGDFSHFRVYRKNAGGEFKLLADNLTSPQYKDSAAVAGTPYSYVVTALDKRGNESEYSNEVGEQL